MHLCPFCNRRTINLLDDDDDDDADDDDDDDDYGALELTDCICGLPVFGHHTAVIAVNIILSKSCCTIFGLHPQLL